MAMKDAEVSGFAAIRRKGYVEGTTTVVSHRAKLL